MHVFFNINFLSIIDFSILYWKKIGNIIYLILPIIGWGIILNNKKIEILGTASDLDLVDALMDSIQ